MTHAHRFRRYRRGFTLVELLVVLSIIALLIGILVPALSRARGAAKDMKCSSNMRQIGTASVSYSIDHDARLPDAGRYVDPTNGKRKGDLVTHGLLPYLDYNAESVISTHDFVWLCPKHDTFQWTGYYTSSYGYNVQYLLEPGPDYPHSGYSGIDNPGMLSTEVQQPSNKLMLVDHDAIGANTSLWSFVARPEDNSSDSALDGFGRPSFRHNDRANILYVDTHVETAEPYDIGPNDERRVWDPR